MTPREHVRTIIAGGPVEHCAFWLGKPPQETQDKLNALLGTSSLEEIQQKLGDDVRWLTPQHVASTYRHPQGRSMRPWRDVNPHGLSGKGLLSDASTVEDVARVPFPEAQYLDFSETLAVLDACGPYYRLSGFWAPFFHDLCYLFGTEELLTLLLMAPEVVQAALDKICGFYFEANERFYEAAGARIDAFFFGNDFGTQNGLLMSPAIFREMFLPWIARFAAQAHERGYACIMHCCGGISDIIDDLITAGVDCLHPLQTRAAGMAPEELAPRFGRRVVFMGGVDTQELLVNGTADEVTQSVQHLRDVFGERIIVGPSHEALLPNVNAHNVLAMAAAAKAP